MLWQLVVYILTVTIFPYSYGRIYNVGLFRWIRRSTNSRRRCERWTRSYNSPILCSFSYWFTLYLATVLFLDYEMQGWPTSQSENVGFKDSPPSDGRASATARYRRHTGISHLTNSQVSQLDFYRIDVKCYFWVLTILYFSKLVFSC